MRAYEFISEEFKELSEILNKVLPYEKIKVERQPDMIATWYEVGDYTVLIRQFLFEGEHIGDVVFYHNEDTFNHKSDFSETTGIVSTVIAICKGLKNITTWFFSSKGGEGIDQQHIAKRSSLYNRISLRMAREDNWNYKPIHSKNSDTFYILSKNTIDGGKIMRFANTYG